MEYGVHHKMAEQAVIGLQGIRGITRPRINPVVFYFRQIEWLGKGVNKRFAPAKVSGDGRVFADNRVAVQLVRHFQRLPRLYQFTTKEPNFNRQGFGIQKATGQWFRDVGHARSTFWS